MPRSRERTYVSIGVPMNRSKAEYFDSQVFSGWASEEYTREEREKIEDMLQRAGWSIEMGILEPGCGTGRLTEILANRAASGGYILASDISGKMIEAARERVAPRDNVRIECAAVEDLDLGAETFDLVLCHQVFPHFDDKERTLKKLTGCLKPSGKLVMFHFINSAQINDMHRKTDPSVMADSMPEAAEMKALLQACGFVIDILRDDDAGYLMIARKSSDDR